MEWRADLLGIIVALLTLLLAGLAFYRLRRRKPQPIPITGDDAGLPEPPLEPNLPPPIPLPPDELALLQQITQGLNQATSLPDIVDLIHQRVEPRIGGLGVLLWIRENSHSYPAAATGLSAGLVSAPLNLRSNTCTCLREVIAGQLTAPRIIPRCELHTALNPEGKPIPTLAIPLLMGKRAVGVLDVNLPEEREFSPHETELLETIAAQLSVAVERVRMYEAEREQRRLAESLHAAGATFAASLEFETVMDRLLEQIPAVIPCDACNVMLVQDGQAVVARIHGYELFGESYGDLTLHSRYTIEDTPTLRQMSRTGRPLFVNDTANEPSWVEPVNNPARSWLGAPVLVKGQVVAFINLDKLEPNFYRQKHADLLASFNSQAALALENAWLFSETSRYLERERHVNEVLRTLSSLLDLPVLLRQAAALTTELLDAQAGLAALLDEEPPNRLEPLLETAPARLAQNLTEADLVTALAAVGSGPLRITDLITHRKSLNPGAAPSRWMDLLLRWETAGVKSLMLAPLRAGAKSAGLLGVFILDGPNRFNERDLLSLEAVARHTAVSVQNVRLLQEQQQRVSALDALRETLNETTTELHLPRLLTDITRRAVKLLKATGGELSLYDPDAQTLEVVVSLNMPTDSTGRRLPVGAGATGLVASSLSPLIIDHHTKWKEAPPRFSDVADRAVVLMPLLAGNQLSGVLMVADANRSRTFGREDVRLLNLFAQQAVIAIRNARLMEQEQNRARESETLRQAGAAVAATLQPDEFIERILEQLAHVIPYDSAGVHMVLGKEARMIGGRGFPNPEAVLNLRLPLDESNPATEMIQTGQPRLYSDIQSDFPAFRVPPHNRIRSWLGAPMVIQGRATGFLSLDALTPGRFNEHHARLVAAFADQVAIALENVRLYQRALLSADRLGALYESGQEIAASLMPTSVCESIRRAVARLMPADILLIGWLEGERKRYEFLYLATPLKQQMRRGEPVDSGPYLKKLMRGQPVRISRMEPQPETSLRLYPTSATGPLIQSLLAVPLKIGGQVVGMLATHSHTPEAYSADDQRLLEMLAAQAAIALDNARLFRESQELASTDPLTHLYNRRQFFNLARTEYERSVRYDRPLCLLMIDLDHFKKFNDLYGHNIGDQVLAGLADIFRATLRKVDVVARYGGEEFVVLLPETDEVRAVDVSDRLRERIAATPIPTDKGELNVTVSIGIGVHSPHSKRLETVIDWADKALYSAKSKGRNRVDTYSE